MPEPQLPGQEAIAAKPVAHQHFHPKLPQKGSHSPGQSPGILLIQPLQEEGYSAGGKAHGPQEGK